MVTLAGIAMLAALAVQETDTVAPSPDRGIRVGGWVTASFTGATRARDGRIVGRMYGGRQARLVLNVADLTLERVPATNRWDAGFRIEPILGTTARIVRSAGLNLGRDADLWQAFAVLNLPAGDGRFLQLKAGKMATLMGVEVFEEIRNPTFDVGPQDIFLEPFSETGAQLHLQLGSRIDAQFRVSQGWDRVSDNNAGKTFTVRLGLAPDAKSSVALLGYTGPEQGGTPTHQRSGAELIVSRRVGPRLAGWLQLDYGKEDGLGSGGGAATWYAAGLWLTYDLSRSAGIGVRGDYACDCDGARTSGGLGFPAHNGQRLTGLALTLNLRRGAHLMLRPELRYDRSTLPVFDGERRQLSGAAAVSYRF